VRGGALARFPWGGSVEERRSSGEWCGLESCSGAAFYRSRRGEEGAPEAVGGGTPAATIKARWSFVGGRYRRERKGKGLSGAG
jgi:hypothetical protein